MLAALLCQLVLGQRMLAQVAAGAGASRYHSQMQVTHEHRLLINVACSLQRRLAQAAWHKPVSMLGNRQAYRHEWAQDLSC